MIDFRELVKAGVHFGHQSSRWSPRMAPYIWGQKNGVHLIDVSKTAFQLEKAAKFLQNTAAEGKTILWVGTKKPAQVAIKEAALTSHMQYVTHRWIGGTLTNWLQVKKSITKYLYLLDVLKKAEQTHYTKKELNSFKKRVDRLEKNIGGIVNMKWPVGAIVVVDVRKEQSAIKEASTMGIPVVALIDTNSDPSLVNYVIPGNDDAPRSIRIVVEYLAEATKAGKEAHEQEQKDAVEKERALLREGPKKKDAPLSAKDAAAAQAPVSTALPKKELDENVLKAVERFIADDK